MRILVLRDIRDRLAVFYSSTSAKHRELTLDRFKASLLVFLPSIGVQYRLRAQLEVIDSEIVHEHWQLKPNAAKRIDALYQRFPQGTIVENATEFETQFAARVPPRQAPSHSVGYYIAPFEIERLELRQDPDMHRRELFNQRDNDWEVQRLVP